MRVVLAVAVLALALVAAAVAHHVGGWPVVGLLGIDVLLAAGAIACVAHPELPGLLWRWLRRR